MNLTVSVLAEFGTFCADGEAAARFREVRIDPYIGVADVIELDFSGVRNTNTSFCNALVGNLVIQNGPTVLRHLRLANCRENVKTLLCAAVELGLTKSTRSGTVLT